MVVKARIYQPAKTAMQSARGNARQWVLEYEQQHAMPSDPLMGWTGSQDTLRQVQLRFTTKDKALAYAEQKGLQVVVQEPRERKIKPKNYAANFAFNKVSA